MKVRELIEKIFFLENIRLVDNNADEDENGNLAAVYEGCVLDMPWIYADWEIAEEDSIYVSENKEFLEIVANEPEGV